MSYKFPVERPLPRDCFDLCYQPSSGDRYVAWATPSGVRYYGPWTAGTVMDQANGLLIWLTATKKVSMCIDALDKIYIAIRLTPSTVELVQDVLGSAIAIQFSGIGAVMHFAGNLIEDSTEVICFYLKAPEQKTVYMRLKSEAFAVERTAITSIDTKLRRLQKTDVLQIGDDLHHFIWALAEDGRQVTFHIGEGLPIPPPPCGIFDLSADEHRDEFECYAVEDPVVSPLNAFSGFSGGWVAHGTAANFKTLQRTIGSIVDTRLRLGVNGIARLLGVGSSWNVLRIGFQLAFNASANIPTRGLYFGLCNGLTNIIGDATTDHFLGVRINTGFASITRNVGPPAYLELNNNGAFRFCKRVGATFSNESNIGQVVMTAAPATNRSCLFLEITKNTASPATSFTAKLAKPNVGGGATITTDITLTQFKNAMNTAAGMAALTADLGVAYVVHNSSATAADESVSGVFNALTISWDNDTHPLELCAVAVKRLS